MSAEDGEQTDNELDWYELSNGEWVQPKTELEIQLDEELDKNADTIIELEEALSEQDDKVKELKAKVRKLEAMVYLRTHGKPLRDEVSEIGADRLKLWTDYETENKTSEAQKAYDNGKMSERARWFMFTPYVALCFAAMLGANASGGWFVVAMIFLVFSGIIHNNIPRRPKNPHALEAHRTFLECLIAPIIDFFESDRWCENYKPKLTYAIWISVISIWIWREFF